MEKSVAGFFFEVSSIGRRPHIDAAPHNARRLGVARALPSEPFIRTPELAGARERAGLRRVSSPPHAAPNGIRFAPQMVCACTATMPHVSSGATPMTAYLISLALIGLVVIAVSEDFS